MQRLLQRLVAALIVGLLSLGAWHLGANASVGAPEPPRSAPVTEGGLPFERLGLLEQTLWYVGEKYVEPSRIDPDGMFRAALDAVERRVPEVLLVPDPEGRTVDVTVGAWRTTLAAGPVRSLDDLHAALVTVARAIRDHLSDEVPLPEIEYALVNGVLGTLDPHSVLLPPEVSREMDVENNGQFGGLGITIRMRDGWLTVEYPLPDTPAWRAGIKAGDRIVRIEGDSTINMDIDEAVERLRGEVGTPVTITVDRDTFDEPREFTIVRDVIQVNAVEGELLEGGVGYVWIKAFHANVSRELDGLLSQFKRANGGRLRGLVLDLRGDSGGFLHQAIEVVDRFVSEGVIVATVERGGRHREEKRARRAGTEPDYPMVVLVDPQSASASEIVAGALKNLGRAVVVGDRTFGKGSVQNLYPFPDDSKLKLTIAHYLTPGDHSIQSIGIQPDVRLVPAIVDQREGRPWVSLTYRDRVTRESDLDHHFDPREVEQDAPLYSLRYLRRLEEEDSRPDQRDLSSDWELQFARDLVLSVPSSRRAEMLAAAADVVERHAREEEARIEEAFDALGVDWRPGGPVPDGPVALEVELDLGEDGRVVGGQAETVELRVTNRSDVALPRVMAVAASDMDWLDGAEFYFGRLDPGATRSWPVPVDLPGGMRDRVDRARFRVMVDGGPVVAEAEQFVRVEGPPLPRYAITAELADPGGDGDGIPEPGERVRLHVALANLGPGPGGEAFARLKNRSGRAVDLQVGSVEVGALPPGESGGGDMEFLLRDPADPLALELTFGDVDRYDVSAVMDAGFYDFYAQKLDIAVPAGSPWSLPRDAAPAVAIDRRPDLVVTVPQVTVSGRVEDDAGVRDAMIWFGDEKVAYEAGGEGVLSLPFTVSVELEPGPNRIVVLARDRTGLHDAHAVDIYYAPGGTAALSPAEQPGG